MPHLGSKGFYHKPFSSASINDEPEPFAKFPVISFRLTWAFLASLCQPSKDQTVTQKIEQPDVRGQFGAPHFDSDKASWRVAPNLLPTSYI